MIPVSSIFNSSRAKVSIQSVLISVWGCRGKPVDIELRSDSIEELKIVSQKVENVLKVKEGVTSTEIDFEEGKKQIVVSVNDQEARRLGVNTRQIAF